jgi:hypothetical protein
MTPVIQPEASEARKSAASGADDRVMHLREGGAVAPVATGSTLASYAHSCTLPASRGSTWVAGGRELHRIT